MIEQFLFQVYIEHFEIISNRQLHYLLNIGKNFLGIDKWAYWLSKRAHGNTFFHKKEIIFFKLIHIFNVMIF